MADCSSTEGETANLKSDYVKSARNFAKRARELNLWPVLCLVSLAVAIVATAAGAFQTGNLPLPQRAGFWLILMMWSAFKWTGWFIWRVKAVEHWWTASALGMLVLNLLLPLEIWISYLLVGVPVRVDPFIIWLQAAAVGLGITIVLLWLHPPRPRSKAKCPLEAHGIALDQIDAVTAEDHYCRIHTAGGEQVLVHSRFSDLLATLEHVDGAQIHRGSWIANRAVTSARRNGKVWELVLPGGTALRVSQTYRKLARVRGWLDR